MINGVDFVYEYSDLNLFHTRVKVLTGFYKDLVFEYGGSMLAQIGDKNTFTFEYILYEVPDKFHGPSLRKDDAFNTFIAYLIVDVISCRKSDPNELEKLHEAASLEGKTTHSIDINEKYYPKKIKPLEQPIVVGAQGF